MAELSEAQLDDYKGRFNAEQHTGVAALRNYNATRVDLAEAERADIDEIRSATRTGLEAAHPDHHQIFTAELSKQLAAGKPIEVAYAEAHRRSPYGRFSLQQERDPDPTFANVLSEVAGFEYDPKRGLDERYELLSAARLLRGQRFDQETIDQIEEERSINEREVTRKRTERDEATATVSNCEGAEGQLRAAEEALEGLSDRVKSEATESARTRELTELNAEITDLRGQITALESRDLGGGLTLSGLESFEPEKLMEMSLADVQSLRDRFGNVNSEDVRFARSLVGVLPEDRLIESDWKDKLVDLRDKFDPAKFDDSSTEFAIARKPWAEELMKLLNSAEEVLQNASDTGHVTPLVDYSASSLPAKQAELETKRDERQAKQAELDSKSSALEGKITQIDTEISELEERARRLEYASGGAVVKAADFVPKTIMKMNLDEAVDIANSIKPGSKGAIVFARNFLGIPPNKRISNAVYTKKLQTLRERYDESKFNGKGADTVLLAELVQQLLDIAEETLKSAARDGNVNPVKDTDTSDYISAQKVLKYKKGQKKKAEKELSNLQGALPGEIALLDTEISTLESELNNLGEKVLTDSALLSGLNPEKIMGMDLRAVRGLSGRINLPSSDSLLFVRIFLDIPADQPLERAIWENKLRTLRTKYDPALYTGTHGDYDARKKPWAEALMELAGTAERVLNQAKSDDLTPISDHPSAELASLRTELQAKEASKTALEATPAGPDVPALVGELDAFEMEVMSFQVFLSSFLGVPTIPGDPDTPRIFVICREYLENYGNQIKAPHAAGTALTKDDFINFIDNTLTPFRLKWKAEFGRLKNGALSGQAQANESLATAEKNQRHLDQQTPITRALEAGFSGMRIIDGKMELDGFESGFTRAKALLDQARDFIDPNKSEIASLTGFAQSLKMSVTGVDLKLPESLKEKYKDLDLGPENGINTQIQLLQSLKTRSRIQTLTQTQINQKLKLIKDNLPHGAVFDLVEEEKKIRDQYDKDLREASSLEGWLGDTIRILENVLNECKTLRNNLKKLIDHLETVQKAGIEIRHPGTNEVIDIKQLARDIVGIDPRNSSFRPQDLMDFYDRIGPFFEDAGRVKSLKDSLALSAKNMTDNINKTDAEIATKIIDPMIAKQFPDLTADQRDQLVAAVLADDYSTLKTKQRQLRLVESGKIASLDGPAELNGREKIIGLYFKMDGKTLEPFKGMKPSDFGIWDTLRKRIDAGSTPTSDEVDKPLEIGFALLAIPGVIDKDMERLVRKHLQERAKERFKIKPHMKDSSFRDSLDTFFFEQIQFWTNVASQCNGDFDEKNRPRLEAKSSNLSDKIIKVQERFKRGEINEETMNKLIKKYQDEAQETGADISSVAIGGFSNSKHGVWVKGLFYDAGKWLGGKAGNLGISALKLAGSGAWGTTKGGLKIVANGALLPVRAVKYPLMVAGKIPLGVLNFIKKNKYEPYNIRYSARTDLARMWGWTKKGATNVAEGSKKAITTIPKTELAKTKWVKTKYEDRAKVTLTELDERIKESDEKAKREPVEITSFGMPSVAKIRKEISESSNVLQFLGKKAEKEEKKAEQEIMKEARNAGAT